ncbi:outer membrane protein assembly factor BamD [uncultured Draconibacterium sp.]|uniref:outer membrane protein assembly factor BamD n=2 Tax=uncultured Draconibacterium sp. TaxID=1573823 RepID=UPI00321661A6
MKMRFLGIGFVLILLVLSSCGDYNKIVKSTDYEFKYKKAVEYYEDGEYVRSGTLFKELVNIYRGTTRADKIYYYYAKSMIGQKDYLMAGHYFRSLVKEFPRSEYTEEAQFMIGYCSYLLSPKPRLDQQVTQEAIDAMQLYINLYPYSERVDEANRLIDEMEDKLVFKSYLSAKLYYDFENFKAAVVALTNSLEKYPDSKYREDLKYMLLKSKYLLATRSIFQKQEGRYSSALDEYFSFIDEFPDSKYKKEIEKYYEKASEILHYQAEQEQQEETNIN